MTLTVKILLITFNLVFLGLAQKQIIKLNDNKPITQSNALPSGFYFINDTLGVQRMHYETKEIYFIEPKKVIDISNIKKVKTTSIKNKVFGKTQERHGLLFTLNDEGVHIMKYASKVAFQKHQKMSLIIKDELVVVFYVNSEINKDTFFIEVETSKNNLKDIEKIIKAELKRS